MNGATAIAVIVLAAILFFAVRLMIRQKKKGAACAGCPYAGSCRKVQSSGACDAAGKSGADCPNREDRGGAKVPKECDR